eukprot:9028788-Lingulodinium_polyedra.AAC.1
MATSRTLATSSGLFASYATSSGTHRARWPKSAAHEANQRLSSATGNNGSSILSPSACRDT